MLSISALHFKESLALAVPLDDIRRQREHTTVKPDECISAPSEPDSRPLFCLVLTEISPGRVLSARRYFAANCWLTPCLGHVSFFDCPPENVLVIARALFLNAMGHSARSFLCTSKTAELSVLLSLRLSERFTRLPSVALPVLPVKQLGVERSRLGLSAQVLSKALVKWQRIRCR